MNQNATSPFKIDIAKTPVDYGIKLNNVGMSHIEIPVRVMNESGETFITPGRAEAYVSLEAPQRGIHMSRLFLHLNEALGAHPISLQVLKDVAQKFRDSHGDLSHSSFVKVEFSLMLERKALKSQKTGWRNYPVTLWARSIGDRFEFGCELKILYSSTCPCSAALARQLIQNRFLETFSTQQNLSRDVVHEWLGQEEAIAGTPHGQRSEGHIQLRLGAAESTNRFVTDCIDLVEHALQTPVQTAVKREDEQEFARLNAANLMFAEDAARRIMKALSPDKRFKGISCTVQHLESLHPHNAVAQASFGENF